MKQSRGHARGAVTWSIPDFPKPANLEDSCDCRQLCEHVKCKAKLLAREHNLVDASGDNVLLFVTLIPGNAKTLVSLQINFDLTWCVQYKNVTVPQAYFLNEVPEFVNIKNIGLLFHSVSVYKVCSGNDDFVDIVEQCVASNQKNLVSHDRITAVGYIHDQTIRSVTCSVFLPQEATHPRCSACSNIRNTLELVEATTLNVVQ